MDTACRDRFTFHRCHLPGSIILVNAVVGRRRCPGRDPPPRRDRGVPPARIERTNDDREISVGGMHVDHHTMPDFFPPNFEVITKRPCCRPVVRPYCRLLFLFLSFSLLSSPLHAPSSFVYHRSQLVVFLPSPWHPSSRLSRATRTSKNQCDVTCALTPGSSGVPTELSLFHPFSLLFTRE